MVTKNSPPIISLRDEEIRDLRKTVAILAAHLLDYAGEDVERCPPLEGDEGAVVFVHGKTCGGSCDYGCGAVAITHSETVKDGDREVTIEAVESGTLQVRGLSGVWTEDANG